MFVSTEKKQKYSFQGLSKVHILILFSYNFI